MTKIGKEYRSKIVSRLLESAEVKKKVAEECLDQIFSSLQLIINIFKKGRKVMICGNGGSAADSQHMAGEFICMLNKAFDRPGLPAIALTTDTSVLTAYANDISFERVFERQVQALGKSGDILIAISTSGNSSNIINAVKAAKASKIATIALTGKKGRLRKMVDIAIQVPSDNTQYIQESHITIEHILCELVEHDLFASKKK